MPDPEAYLTKGYYVGSMLNLSELAPTAPDTEMPGHHPHTNFMSQQYSQMAPVSSSSSSSTNGCFTNNNNNNKNQSLVKHSHDDSQLSNNLQRRTSVHEATSISMANLNFLNSNFNATGKCQQGSSFMARQKSSYGKQRAATTAILDTDFAEHQHETLTTTTTTTTGSSAPSSDSSSSPNPMVARAGPKVTTGLGPLMSAVTKLESVGMISSPRNGLGGFIEHRFFNGAQGADLDHDQDQDQDDFDEYEYLEKNFGAEPPFSSNALLSQRRSLEGGNSNLLENTTTNTNVTDYYTDESNSCTNDNEYQQFNSSKTLCNADEALGARHQQQRQQQQQQRRPLNGQYLSVGGFEASGNASTTQLNKLSKPSPRAAWDQASIVSNNSAFSGLYSHAQFI